MFRPKPAAPVVSPDYTHSLRDVHFFRPGHLRSLGLQGDLTALGYDPVLGLLAAGTSTGRVHLSGKPAVQCTWSLYATAHAASSAQGREEARAGVKFLVFHPGERVVVVDTRNVLHVWLVGKGGMDDVRSVPRKVVTLSLYGDVTFLDQPNPATAHVAVAMRDGHVVWVDLERGVVAGYKVENQWARYEERLKRSGWGRGGGSGARKPPRAAYAARDGGVVLWDIKERAATKTFEMVLPPGSPGGSSYTDPAIWSERMPPVTSLAWHPDGTLFVAGHEDGCLTFWSLEDPDKPLLVRTIEREDVNVTDVESLFDAGALDAQQQRGPAAAAAAAGGNEREPVFKLAWTSFPDQAGLKTLLAAQGTSAAAGGEPLTNATVEYAERGETVLVVLGGCIVGAPSAIHVLQLPAFVQSVAPVGAHPPSSSSGQGLSLVQRNAWRDSLAVTGITTYPTATPAEDFLLVPRLSPYFNLWHDPIAIIIFLTPDPTLPPIQAPHGGRSIDAWGFPPPRSDVAPEETGRKKFRTVEDEVHGVMPMTAAPLSPNHRGGGRNLSGVTSPGGTPGWKMPWSPPAAASPHPLLYAPSGIPLRAVPPRPFRLPSLFWSGRTNVLGCEIYPLDNIVFTRLISWAIAQDDNPDKPRLPGLRGGMAVPDLVSANAPDPGVIKMENYRVLATYSADGCVRFWDISPHLLVLPTPLRFEYPAPLPHLTISIPNILRHPSLSHHPLAQLYRSDPSKVRITGVELAKQSLEVAITMQTGEVLMYKFGEANARLAINLPSQAHEEQSYFPTTPQGGHAETRAEHVEELTSTAHLANWKADGFKPVTMLTTRRGHVVETALCDIGFLAVAYAQKSVVIVDLRGPDVILREGFTEEGLKVKKKKKGSQNVPADSSQCMTLKWTICRLGGDQGLAPRLILGYARGSTKIYSLNSVLGEWVVETKPATHNHDSLSNPIKNYILDYETGAELVASADAFQRVTPTGTKASGTLWLAISKRAIRAQVNFNGEKIGKVDLVDTDEVHSAVVFIKNGHRVLMTVTQYGSANFYSLPTLEFIYRTSLDISMLEKPLGRLSFDSSSGDYIEYISPMEIYLRTVFNHRKPLTPRIDPATDRLATPPPPVPLTATWGVTSWIWGGAPMTGPQFDALIAGPNRAPIPKSVAAAKPPKPLITWGAVPEKIEPAYQRPTVAKKSQGWGVLGTDPRQRVDLYEQMTRAAAERGNILEGLEDQMTNMTTAAADMLKSARNAAAKESAKATAKSIFKF
ncbi:hypothetical protein QFC19_004722 [Naganishia cerealis]|uniref:Uncharacterized protein n=1 Tax=Naganishia cerealis TaxID=610337 RepID=A0ACC2VTU5_9TREE|nr:hypothetical protein QFC19_004722 [Naganishia cerealis]